MRSNRNEGAAEEPGDDEVRAREMAPPARPRPLGVGGGTSVSGASGGGFGISPLLFEPDRSTPLEPDEPDTSIPPAVLWAMQDRKHSSWRPESEEDGRIRGRLGADDGVLYVIDDGRDHCMIGRFVGRDTDGCVYCLVARIRLDRFEDLRSEDVSLEQAFAEARDICLSAVFESDSASNVVHLQHYRRAEDVPVEYLPPSPFLEFS